MIFHNHKWFKQAEADVHITGIPVSTNLSSVNKVTTVTMLIIWVSGVLSQILIAVHTTVKHCV